MAILAIIALGVGFFSGLKVTKQAMSNTITDFLKDMNFYDLHLLSTLGFSDEDVEAFGGEDQVSYAEGSYSFDLLYDGMGENERVLKTMSIPEYINGIELVDGRMPENMDECVVDSRINDVAVGDTITLTETNNENTLSQMTVRKFVVTGTVNSSYYINFERGTTTLGNGKIYGFAYVMPEAFDCDCYTDVFVTFDTDYDLYSDEYDEFIDEKEEKWDDICKNSVTKRYKNLLMQTGLTEDMVGDINIDDLDDVSYYILDRGTNIGYVCFESDSDIVDGVAKVFPVFFILVAVLVCMTTMNRMVEEQRTMIGMLKALGYGEGTIMSKYMIYSGTAALIGCVGGYMAGTYIFPKVIWYAYQMMYINLKLEYVFDIKLAALALATSMLCTIGTTWFSCRYELAETAAGLMRPKAPKAGKRVLLERIPFIWKRLKFLKKVSVRNIFRYKKRFFMMIIGISGCTALLLTGFGLNDSIAGFADVQYGDIQTGDGTIGLKNGMNRDSDNSLTDKLDEMMDSYDFVSETSWELVEEDSIKSINVVVMEEPEHIAEYMNFYNSKEEKISYPGKDEAVINNALADLYNLSVGDEITIRNSEMKEINVEISGIFENHVYNYVYISPETYENQMGAALEYRSVYFNLKEDFDAHQASAELMENEQVSAITINKDMKNRIAQMMKSLNYIVILVILSAAALAFIVLYNLTNINITERIREIATIKVLGFFRNETSSYVFRENRVLTAFGIAVGLVFGIFLHRFVIGQIHVDMVSFDVYIAPMSYVYSIILTFVFNFCVNLIMSARLERINMAESLKSVD
ncbi:MAG: FtsX-like permease family protein [Coprococcus sp.]